ncbi:hypothetical protein [Sphingosinicella sp. BN140058]|uniref:hypothetical protein n=1 Tax=Sphingosinicella sp. BN140058 TaxID=1892855 RepID=UPI001010CEEB|nr:hypothetical protein [Sphingosinicella sp. BN140058]QAY75366.1 hypothetical protein ETR14_01590 [Sphingosinicella sp. BN140058]
MSGMITLAALSTVALIGLGLTLLACLKAWQGWLDLKRLELGAAPRHSTGGSMTELIEMADLKERIRKLESIAACVDL